MDPDENLKEVRTLSNQLIKVIDVGDELDLAPVNADDAGRLCDLTQALDKRILKGGFLPREWAAKCNGGLLKRAELAARVYKEAFDGSETFEGEFGTQLAYLFGAILHGTTIVLDMENPEKNGVWQFFKRLFSDDHPVWGYITLENQPPDEVSSN